MQSLTKKALFIASLPVILIMCAVGAFFFHSRDAQRSVNPSLKVNIVATIYPLGDFAKQIGGALVDVTTITPPGAEPHEYEPTPQDIVKLYKAEEVIMNGGGVDAWAEKLLPDLRAKGVRVVRMSDEIEALPTDSGAPDPHFWLDPLLARQAVETISWPLALTLHDPLPMLTRKDTYTTRLEALDQAYQAGLAHCAQHEIVTTHNAFRYLAKRYHLTNLYILGLSPEEDPSPQTIAQVATLAQDKGIKTIFFETLVSPKLAQTIANEIGAQTAVLNPIEGLTQEELAAGKDYIQVMQDNLLQLRAALHCT